MLDRKYAAQVRRCQEENGGEDEEQAAKKKAHGPAVRHAEG
jgi:hypothetical protein